MLKYHKKFLMECLGEISKKSLYTFSNEFIAIPPGIIVATPQKVNDEMKIKTTVKPRSFVKQPSAT